MPFCSVIGSNAANTYCLVGHIMGSNTLNHLSLNGNNTQQMCLVKVTRCGVLEWLSQIEMICCSKAIGQFLTPWPVLKACECITID